jgi:alanine racemase
VDGRLTERGYRPAWAEVDLSAISANAAALAELAPLCAVVKANAYGHGAPEVARAALAGGASWLAVALVEEGVQLRDAGIDAPVLVLAEPTADAMAEAHRRDLTPTLYTEAGVKAAAEAATATAPWPVHVKIDTGMHRVGASPDDLDAVVAAVTSAASLEFAGLWTHLAVADEPEQDEFTALQLDRFEAARSRLEAAGVVPPLVHAANSAGALAHPLARYDLIRCGIALYGHRPSPAVTPVVELRPAMSLKARVSHVRCLDAGERISYGRRYETAERTVIATVPLGYADGVTRRLFDVGGQLLVGGRRCPIAGVVTMDQLMLDCGPDADVHVGDEVVVLGRQGDDEITAWELAELLGTISYEVLCAVGPRVPRVYLGR